MNSAEFGEYSCVWLSLHLRVAPLQMARKFLMSGLSPILSLQKPPLSSSDLIFQVQDCVRSAVVRSRLACCCFATHLYVGSGSG